MEHSVLYYVNMISVSLAGLMSLWTGIKLYLRGSVVCKAFGTSLMFLFLVLIVLWTVSLTRGDITIYLHYGFLLPAGFIVMLLKIHHALYLKDLANQGGFYCQECAKTPPKEAGKH